MLSGDKVDHHVDMWQLRVMPLRAGKTKKRTSAKKRPAIKLSRRQIADLDQATVVGIMAALDKNGRKSGKKARTPKRKK